MTKRGLHFYNPSRLNGHSFVRQNEKVMKFSENMFVKELKLQTIDDRILRLPDENNLVHLQFRRFAGCPVCNYHLRTFMRRKVELDQHGIREVILFHSFTRDMKRYAGYLPFDMVADPFKKVYAEFGVEAAAISLFHPKAWLAILRSVGYSLYQVVFQKKTMPPLRPYGGSFGLPADFLIAPDGKILAAHYGQHANDQWSVDELLSLCRRYEKSNLQEVVLNS